MLRRKTKTLRLLLKWFAAFGTLGLVSYPIIVKPMLDPSDYKEIQKIGRAGIDQAKIQPGNMRIWSDPFQPRK